jgi:hypothetical protein
LPAAPGLFAAAPASTPERHPREVPGTTGTGWHHRLVVIVEGLGHLIGADGNEWYNFWSGMGADVGQVALFGAAIGLYRKHNCHVHRCWRIAKQQVEGTTWMVCHKHHPDGKPTEAHMAALAERKRAADAGSSVTLPD